MDGPAIEVRGLRKRYGEVEAVAGIDLRVERGEVFALLGPNGAGKTTAVEIMEGHRQRTAGEVRVLGFDPEAGDPGFKERIGIVLQETGVEPYLTVAETIELFCGYYPNPLAVEDVIELVGLREQRDRRVSKLSGGQQRRLDVAVGLAGNPELIFLDEPTTGFDPAARRGAWEMIRGLKSLGKTVFLTTHYLDEAEQLAGRVAIISKGVIVAQGTPASLIAAGQRTRVRFRQREGGSDWMQGIAADVTANDGYVVIETERPTALLFELTQGATERGIELQDLSVTRPSLEDVYLRIVGEEEQGV